MTRLLLLAVVAAGGLGAERFAVMPENSRVQFLVAKMGIFRVEGRFLRFSGTVDFDPARVSASAVSVRVEAGSVETGDSDRNSSLRSADFFDVGRFPEWTFTSTRAEACGVGCVRVGGELTIRGVTRPLSFDARLGGVREAAGIGRFISFDTAFVVDRTEFGVLGLGWTRGRALIGHEVEVRIELGGLDRGRR